MYVQYTALSRYYDDAFSCRPGRIRFYVHKTCFHVHVAIWSHHCSALGVISRHLAVTAQAATLPSSRKFPSYVTVTHRFDIVSQSCEGQEPMTLWEIIRTSSTGPGWRSRCELSESCRKEQLVSPLATACKYEASSLNHRVAAEEGTDYVQPCCQKGMAHLEQCRLVLVVSGLVCHVSCTCSILQNDGCQYWIS